jgi:predicted signal transduction protein with EAL and GGDEF domain
LLDALSPQPVEALKQAQTIADKVLKLLGQSYSLQGHAHDSSVSIGIHIFTGNTESQDQLLNKADLAMYRAKTMGRNTLCFYSPDMQAQAQAKENLIQTLCASLAGQELELYYQVQLDARGVPVGALASLHWRHALHGSMAEREINSLADEAGISLPLVQWTLQAACHQLQEWEQQPLTANWTLTLKISWGQLLQLDLGVILAAVTEKSSRCAKRLILELPGADMARYSDQGLELEDVIARMSALRATGLRFCLGDMGDGLPSLAALRRLPLAQLNLGPALLRSALRDNSVAVIARAMVELGRSLGLWVNATGIATVPEHDLVVAMGCNTLQGDLFGPAVLPLVLLRDLSKHSNAGTQWQDHEATK